MYPVDMLLGCVLQPVLLSPNTIHNHTQLHVRLQRLPASSLKGPRPSNGGAVPYQDINT
jgi:hypothetical protein